MKPKPKPLAIIRSMPPKSHWPDKSQPFDVLDSEVAEWISSQPDIRQFLFNISRDRGLIVFDQDTGCWRGVDWKPAKPKAIIHERKPESFRRPKHHARRTRSTKPTAQ